MTIDKPAAADAAATSLLNKLANEDVVPCRKSQQCSAVTKGRTLSGSLINDLLLHSAAAGDLVPQ
jgi:hypothetical protein